MHTGASKRPGGVPLPHPGVRALLITPLPVHHFPPLSQSVVEEQSLAPDERVVANVGKTDAKKHLAMDVSSLMAANIIQVCIAVGGTGGTWWCRLSFAGMVCGRAHACAAMIHVKHML